MKILNATDTKVATGFQLAINIVAVLASVAFKKGYIE